MHDIHIRESIDVLCPGISPGAISLGRGLCPLWLAITYCCQLHSRDISQGFGMYMMDPAAADDGCP